MVWVVRFFGRTLQIVRDEVAKAPALRNLACVEVRVILEAYSDEMRNSGANYQEMFRKVKNELVRKYKAVL